MAKPPTRKRAPPNDATSSIPNPPKKQASEAPGERSRPMKVPAAAKPMATATRNSTCPMRVAVLVGAASVGLAWVGRVKALGSCKIGSVDVGRAQNRTHLG